MKFFNTIKQNVNNMNIFIKSWFLNGKINSRFLLIVMLFTVIPCILIYSISGYFVKSVIIKSYMPEYLHGIYSNIEKNINNYFTQINNFTTSVTADSSIYNTWLKENMSKAEKENSITNTIKSRIDDSDFIYNVDIITTDNSVLRAKDEYLTPIDGNFINEILPSNVAIYSNTIKNVDGDNLLVFGKRLYNFKTGYLLGYMYIYVDESTIFSTFEDVVTNDTNIFIMNGDKVISHKDKSNIGRLFMVPNMIDNNFKINDTIYGVYNLTLDTNTGSKWKVVSTMSYKNLYRVADALQRKIWYIFIFAILLSILLSLFISWTLIRSINELKKKMEQFVSGDIQNVQFKFREIAAIENSFDQMVVEINDLIEKNNEEREKQRIAEMKALQAQINPHFIYNALDAIQWHAKLKKQTYIADMIYALSSFFRISLHKGDNIIKVWEEVKYVKSYVEIEKMRFPQLFDVIYHIDEDILNCDIPKIVLQPIFENAIKHGFEDMESGGLIILTGYRDKNGDIMFEVEDNGKGLDCDPLDENRVNKGYGVRNVNERLQLAYGVEYGLTYRSISGECTWVGVKIKAD